MDAAQALTALQELERDFSRLHARRAELLVLVASPECHVQEHLVLDARDGHDRERVVRVQDAIREEVACALRWSTATAQERIDVARLLHGSLSLTRNALASGEITYSHVRVIVEAANRFPAAALEELQRRILPVASRGTLRDPGMREAGHPRDRRQR